MVRWSAAATFALILGSDNVEARNSGVRWVQTRPGYGNHVLTVDCTGGISVMHDTPFEVAMNLTNLKNAIEMIATTLVDEAKCACPDASQEEIMRRFVPSVPILLSKFSHIPTDLRRTSYKLETAHMVNSCMFNKSGSEPIFRLMNDVASADGGDVDGFELPSTCTYKSFQEGKGCQFSVNGEAGYTISENMKWNVVIDRCEGDMVWPFIDITCEGVGCSTWGHSSCLSDSECDGSGTCDLFYNASKIETLFDQDFTGYAWVPNSLAITEFFQSFDRLYGVQMQYRTCSDYTMHGKLSSWIDLFSSLFGSSGSNSNSTADGTGYYEDNGFDISKLFNVVLGKKSFARQVEVRTPVFYEETQGEPVFNTELCASKGCMESFLGNGFCNPDCNIPECLMDGNECNRCDCVEGTDTSRCEIASLYPSASWVLSQISGTNYYFDIPRSIDLYNSENCRVVADPLPSQKWIPDNQTCSQKIPESFPAWFCTITAEDAQKVRDMNGMGILFPVDWVTGWREQFPDVECLCAFPADLSNCALPSNLGITFDGLRVDPLQCTDAQLPEKHLPAYTLRTVQVPALTAYQAQFVDKSGSSRYHPSTLVEKGNVVNFNCDGDLVITPLQDKMSLAISFRGLPLIVSTFEDMVNHLYRIWRSDPETGSPGADPTGEEIRLGYAFWRPEFFLAAITPENLFPTAIRRNFTQKDFGNSIRPANESITFSNAPKLDLATFLEFGTASVKFLRFTELLSWPIKLSVEVTHCENPAYVGKGINVLSKLAIALESSVLEKLFSWEQVCTDPITDSCTDPNFLCYNLDEVFGLSTLIQDNILSNFIWLRTAPAGQCMKSSSSLQGPDMLSRALLFSSIFGGDLKKVVDSGKLLESAKLLMGCLPSVVETISQLFEEGLFLCNGMGSPDLTNQCSARSIESCTSPQPVCAYDNILEPLSSEWSCDSNLAVVEHKCDSFVCAVTYIPQIITASASIESPLTVVAGFQTTERPVNLVQTKSLAFDQCNSFCTASQIEQTLGYQLGQNDGFSCVRSEVCEDSVEGSSCAIASVFRTAVSNVTLNGECNPAFPFSFASSTLCCSTNPSLLSLAARSVLDSTWCLGNGGKVAKCAFEGCEDFTLFDTSKPVEGTCTGIPVGPCSNTNFLQQKIQYSDSRGLVKTETVHLPSLSHCDALCQDMISNLTAVTCNCTVEVEGKCTAFSPSCIVDKEPGSGYSWLDGLVLSPESSVKDFNTISTAVAAVAAEPYLLKAPELLYSIFSPNGDGAIIQFDMATNQATDGSPSKYGYFSCKKTLRVIGAETGNHACLWLNKETLAVRFEWNSPLTQSISITFITGNGIRAIGGVSQEVKPSVFPIDQEVELNPLIFNIKAAEAVTICDEYFPLSVDILSGETFREASVSVYLLSFDQTFSQDFQFTSGKRLLIPTKILTPGMNYTIDVNVQTIFSSLKKTIVIQYINAKVPTLSVQSIGLEKALRNGLDSAKVLGNLQYNCALDSKEGFFLYRWSVIDGNSKEVALFAENKQSGILNIKPSMVNFTAGDYKLRVDAMLSSDSTVAASSFVSFSVVPAPIVSVIVGGNDRTMYNTQPIALDGSLSCDPNLVSSCDIDFGYQGPKSGGQLLPSGVALTWSCESRDSLLDPWAACTNIQLSNSVVLQFPPNALLAGKRYRFALTIDKSVSKFVNIWVRPEPPLIKECTSVPKISIKPVPEIVNARNGLVLFAVVEGYVASNGSKPLHLAWEYVFTESLENGTTVDRVVPATQFSPIVNRESLFIQPGTLIPGNTYTFRLNARQPCTDPNHPYSDVTFRTNIPPSAGVIEASNTTGQAFYDEFSFQLSGFADVDSADPVSYALEYVLDRPKDGVVIDPKDTYPLSAYSSSSFFTTTFEFPASNSDTASIFVIPVARDSLGAESPRSTYVEIVLSRPVIDTETLDASTDFSKAILRGEDGDTIVRIALSFASAANLVGSTNPVWVSKTQVQVLQALASLNERLAENIDTEILAMEINVLLTMVSDPINQDLDTSVTNGTVVLIQSLVDEMKGIIERNRRSLDDPSTIDILPPSLSTSALNAIASTIRNIQNGLYSANSRRRLQAQQSGCAISILAKKSIQSIARLVLEGLPDGAPTQDFSVKDIQVAAGVDAPDALGSKRNGGDGLSDFALPPPTNLKGKASQTTSGNSTSTSRGGFVLPPGVLDKSLGSGSMSPSRVFVLGVSFAFNIRCDAGDSLVVDQCDNITAYFEWEGPIEEVSDVISLDFFDANDIGSKYDPADLDEGNEIIVQVPRGSNLNNSSFCGNETVLEAVCGYFDNTNMSWSTYGCSLASNQSDPDLVICECNHASDYSAWMQFTSDVKSTFSDPVTAVTSVALLVLGVLFPTIVLFLIISLLWARRRDKVESDTIQKGAIGMLYMRRIQLRAKQKQFFDRLRKLRSSKVQMQDILKEVNDEKDSSMAAEKSRRRRNWCSNFILALRYEHSILGLFSKYDPVYSRVQRVAVFFAVIVGNLLSAAFFFQLKNGDEDISFGFLVGVVFMASLMVSIPIRLFVKVLFRTSDNPQGTKGERVRNLYRVTSKLHDDMPQHGADLDLVMAYKNLYTAKQKLELAKRLEKEKKKGAGAIRKESSDTLAAVVVMKDGMEDEENDSHDAPVVPGKVLNDEESESSSQAEVLSLATAQDQVSLARLALVNATSKAKESWGQGPTAEAIERVKRIKRQRSVVMRVSALLADEASPRAKGRKPVFSYRVKVLGYIVLAAFYVFSAYYITRFVLTRANSNNSASENEVILLWLGTAAMGVIVGYAIAEPVVMGFRFALFPWMLTTCGKGYDNPKDQVSEPEKASLTSFTKAKKSDGHVYEEGKRLAGERQASMKTLFIWEMAADMVEAGF